MTGTHPDSERFLSVAHGLSRWSAEEAAHLEQCAECRVESSLIRTVSTLGRSASSRIVPDRVADRVARRLASEPVAAVARKPLWWVMGVAAAAAITLAIVRPVERAPSAPASRGHEIEVLHELDGLSTAELEAVLETLPPASNEAVHVEIAPMGELSARDLERMLHSME